MEHPFAKINLVDKNLFKKRKKITPYKNPLFLKNAKYYLPKKNSHTLKRKKRVINKNTRGNALTKNTKKNIPKKKKVGKKKRFMLKRL